MIFYFAILIELLLQFLIYLTYSPNRVFKTVLNGLYRVDVDVYRHLVDSVLGIKQTLV